MRRKTKRDLIALTGVVILIVAVVFINTNVNRFALIKEMDALRREKESEQRANGMEVMRWDLIRKTTGNLRAGAQFDERLLEYDGAQINIVGFMVPDKTFREVKEFVLLPLPIECYFCESPPLRDVMYVQMKEGETTSIWDGPVVMNGTLNLSKGEKIKTFYYLTDATVGPGQYTRKNIKTEHMAPTHTQDVKLEEGMEPPIKLDYK